MARRIFSSSYFSSTRRQGNRYLQTLSARDELIGNQDECPVCRKNAKHEVYINMIIAVTAIIAIIISTWQGYLTNESLKLTRQVFHEQKKNDSIAEINTNKRFRMDSTNLDIQLRTLLESQNRFEAENYPHLEVRELTFGDSTLGNVLSISFSIHNLGKSTALLKNTRFLYRLGKYYNINELLNSLEKMQFVKSVSYVTPVHPYISETNFKIVESDFDIAFQQTDMYIYFFGEIQYLNQTTKRDMKYRFVMKWNPFTAITKTLYGKNEQIR